MQYTEPEIMGRIETEYLNNKIQKDIDMTAIQRFYSNANVFITGGTGFMGKMIIEKLLRSCQNISTIYLLIRNKKGKNMHTRLDEIFEDVIFQEMKKAHPKYRHKVVGLAGDCSLPDLGLSDQDKAMMINEVNVIFHVAATVRFDEQLQIAVPINVRSSMDLLRLAHQMKSLKSYIHVSTAFVNCINKVIGEEVYPSPFDYKKLIAIAENLPEKILDKITPSILGDYPNTYNFTKMVAESVVGQEGQGLPVGMVRPGIVISTYKEPIPGWINNMYGATGVAAAAGLGIMRCLHCDPDCTANIVPVDMCVNTIVASAWDVATSFEDSKKENQNFEMPVYNYESSNDQPITWKEFMAGSRIHGMPTPSVKAIWYYSLVLCRSYPWYLVYSLFVHTIPALIADAILLCVGKKPRMLNVYKKISKFLSVISYFATKTWQWDSHNVRRLVNKMSAEDNAIFFTDLKKLNWDEYFRTYIRGVRIYIFDDPLETLPEARKKWNRLFLAHQAVKIILFFLLVRILWYFITTAYGFMV